MTTNNINFKKKLTLSGGGIKGISHIGVLYALNELDCLNHFEEFSGTSVGGFIIALYLIGYSPTELYELIKKINPDKIKNISIFNIHLFGFDTGSKLENIIKKLLKKKNVDENITLSGLFDLNKKKLTLVTVCLNTMEACYISCENYPDLPLYVALRMTTSIPFVFCPVLYNNKMYIDGACLDNYPMVIFKDNLDDAIGFLLVDNKNVIDNIDNLESYIMRIFECLLYGTLTKSKMFFKENTIEIDMDITNVVDYNIDSLKKDNLFMKGYEAVIKNKHRLFR